MTPAQILNRAADKLDSPDVSLTFCTFARDAQGESVDPTADSAVCFCTLGAIHAAMGTNGMDPDNPKMMASPQVVEILAKYLRDLHPELNHQRNDRAPAIIYKFNDRLQFSNSPAPVIKNHVVQTLRDAAKYAETVQ